jgi:hypothetical protein
LGFFFYQKSGLVHQNPYRETFHAGCDRYTATFEEDFIAKDETWKVARIMASIAVCSGLISSVLAWLIVLTPVPAGCFWPTVLLPLVMLSFIAEGSKFLIFDIALCSNSVWLPSGVDSLPQTAASCTLGTTAIVGIVSGSLFLLSLLMVCLYTPERRLLDPNYGISYSSRNEVITTKEASETIVPIEDCTTRRVDQYPMPDVESEFGDEDVYTSAGASETRTNYSEQHSTAKSDDSYNIHSMKMIKDRPSIDSSMIAKMDDVIVGDEAVTPSTLHHPQTTPTERISESRLSKMEELELNRSNFPPATDSLIDQLVSELNDSLGGPVLTDASTAPITNLPLHISQAKYMNSSRPESDFESQQRFL